MEKPKPKLIAKGLGYLAILILMNYVIRLDLAFDAYMSDWALKILTVVIFVLVLGVYFHKNYLIRFITPAYLGGYYLGKSGAWLVRSHGDPENKYLLMTWIILILFAMFLAGYLDHPELPLLPRKEEEDDDI